MDGRGQPDDPLRAQRHRGRRLQAVKGRRQCRIQQQARNRCRQHGAVNARFGIDEKQRQAILEDIDQDRQEYAEHKGRRDAKS